MSKTFYLIIAIIVLIILIAIFFITYVANHHTKAPECDDLIDETKCKGCQNISCSYSVKEDKNK